LASPNLRKPVHSNGMMAVEHKKRVVKKRAKQAALGAEVRPTELREQDMAASKNETTENVKSVSLSVLQIASMPIRKADDADCRNTSGYDISKQTTCR
jgi:hypothetical protein